ncbi:MspA family porin [Nocardia miyunensis]|uniref:MspA family porin n=1 Tax=Nocardia miyunensis TaxID=282684 RepID=UPI00082BA3E7|nr:MspA family porin [Nocardia miyunensis]
MKNSLKRKVRTIATIAGAMALTSVLATQANADALVRLPDVSANGDDGLSIVARNQSALISPSLAANGAGRNAWIGGDITIDAPHIDVRRRGPNNGPSGEDKLPGTNDLEFNGGAAIAHAGFVVGCQVSVGDLSLGGTGSLSSSALGLSGSLSIPLSPGGVSYGVLDRMNIDKPGTYHISFNAFEVSVQGCGGYAQARIYAAVETTGNSHQKLIVYSQPFSIG